MHRGQVARNTLAATHTHSTGIDFQIATTMSKSIGKIPSAWRCKGGRACYPDVVLVEGPSRMQLPPLLKWIAGIAQTQNYLNLAYCARRGGTRAAPLLSLDAADVTQRLAQLNRYWSRKRTEVRLRGTH